MTPLREVESVRCRVPSPGSASRSGVRIRRFLPGRDGDTRTPLTFTCTNCGVTQVDDCRCDLCGARMELGE